MFMMPVYKWIARALMNRHQRGRSLGVYLAKSPSSRNLLSPHARILCARLQVPLEQPFPMADGSTITAYRSTYVATTTIYSVSLFVLYLSSTLYHSLFALGDTVVYIFGIFDHCAIYFLIAGSYRRALTWHQQEWAL